MAIASDTDLVAIFQVGLTVCYIAHLAADTAAHRTERSRTTSKPLWRTHCQKLWSISTEVRICNWLRNLFLTRSHISWYCTLHALMVNVSHANEAT